LQLRAQDELRIYAQNMKMMPDAESDFMKAMNKARKNVMSRYDLMHELILMSKTSGRDYEFLLGKDPLFIVRNFIGGSLAS
jgi:hypothetical protein